VETLLGARYRLSRRIATGGMGEVWTATDTLLGRSVAVKLLRPELAGDEASAKRFRAEAQATASLNHPNIATIYDYGEVPDGRGGRSAYLVMELVDGEPLSALIRGEGALVVARSLHIVAQAAAALHAAHRRGIVHRDVKPANLLVGADDNCKVTDFGIARAMDAAALTEVGSILGTVQYMAPEQLSGHKATPSSDIYALGVVLYECVAGHRPFPDGTAMSMALAHVHRPVPPLPPSVPAPVRRLVTQMLEKDPTNRPATAGAVAVTIRSLAAKTKKARPVAPPSNPPRAPVADPALTQFRTEPLDPIVHAPPGDATEHLTMTVAAPAGVALRRRRRGRTLAIGLIAIALMATGSALWITARPAPVTVPRLQGLPVRTATDRLAGLGLHTRARSTDAVVPAGQVIGQHPRAGTHLSDGNTVTLTVASGYVDVGPSRFDGQSYSQAAAGLIALGLSASPKNVTTAAATAGTVIAVTPSGRLRLASTVTVELAAAPVPPTTIPPTTVPKGHKHGTPKIGPLGAGGAPGANAAAGDAPVSPPSGPQPGAGSGDN
jgi:serine/threonine-protein kinase